PNRMLFSRVDTVPVIPPTVDNYLANPGFESGVTGWSASNGVITNIEGAPARGGDWKAWMTGYGKVHTDTLTQSVTVPLGAAPTLSFYLLVGSEEGTTRARDTLKVEVVSDTTATTV